ncbi:MAG: ABC transporter permease [Planctomycetota bacterium]
MTRTLAIWRKELKSYFNSPIAYVFMVLFLLYAAAKFFIWSSPGPYGAFRGNFFIQGEASLTDYFSVFPLVLAFLVPALCMRLWPEEYKSGTVEVLMTLPVKPWQVVFGKFFAMVTILLFTFVLSFSVPWAVNLMAVDGLDWGPVIGGYVAAFLMGTAYCSIGLLTSAFAREQVVALLAALFICLPLAVAGTPDIDLFTPTWLSPFGKFIGFSVRFESIEKGVLDVRDMLYFTSFTGLFVFLNIVVVEFRRLR